MNSLTKSSTDLVTLVNESDEILGTMDKIEAHRGDAKRHRAVSVFLFQKNKDATELLIQQRAEVKIVGAHQWANTACGNVRPTESYEECAYRRLKEELGITEVKLEPMYKFEYHLKCGVLTKQAQEHINSTTSRKLRDNDEFSEWEMDQVFLGWYNGEVTPNPDEAQDFRWVKWEELQQKEKKAKLRAEEFKTKNIELDKQMLTLAPWFVWMLSDQRLIEIINNYLKKETYA